MDSQSTWYSELSLQLALASQRIQISQQMQPEQNLKRMLKEYLGLLKNSNDAQGLDNRTFWAIMANAFQELRQHTQQRQNRDVRQQQVVNINRNQRKRRHIFQDYNFRNNQIQPKMEIAQYTSPIEWGNRQKLLQYQVLNTIFGPFLIIKQIGKGSFGTVKICIHLKTKSVFAVKIIEKCKLKNNYLKQRLLNEIKIGMFAEHRNLVKIYNVTHDERNIYIIMELMQSSLNMVMKKRRDAKYFQQKQSKAILRDVSNGLNYLHSTLHIIHRDIKPQNIVQSFGYFKICDFGFAVRAKMARGSNCGTQIYMAPEILNNKQYSTPVDIWALGIIAFQLLACPSLNSRHLAKIREGRPQFPNYLSDQAKRLIYILLNLKPSQRPTASQLLESSFLRQNLTFPQQFLRFLND